MISIHPPHITVVVLALLEVSQAFSPSSHHHVRQESALQSLGGSNRREFLSSATIAIGSLSVPQLSWAADIDTEDFLKTGSE